MMNGSCPNLFVVDELMQNSPTAAISSVGSKSEKNAMLYRYKLYYSDDNENDIGIIITISNITID